jgi:hypothetical protein
MPAQKPAGAVHYKRTASATGHDKRPPPPGQNHHKTVVPDGRPNRQKSKREAQLAATEKKALAEVQYFRQCQREAFDYGRETPDHRITTRITTSDTSTHKNAAAAAAALRTTEAELFGQQGAEGIHFKNYNDIAVEVRRSSSAAPLVHSTLLDTGSFEPLPMPATVKRAVVDLMKYQTPTPIQRHAIPAAMAGDDLMCCAQTGSGAFSLVCLLAPFFLVSLTPLCLLCACSKKT